MTAQTLLDESNFCFTPADDVETEVQQIRIVIEGLAGHVPTALASLNLDDALVICDKLNRRLGYDREAWIAMAAASMQAEDDDPESGARRGPGSCRRNGVCVTCCVCGVHGPLCVQTKEAGTWNRRRQRRTAFPANVMQRSPAGRAGRWRP